MKLFTKYIRAFMAICTLLIVLCACAKMVTIEPPINQITNENVFTNDNSATAAMIGIYSKFITTTIYDFTPTLLPSLSSDELINYTTNLDYTNFNNNAIITTSGVLRNIWSINYNIIYQCNALIENINTSTGISNATKKQLTGEAKFMRAFFYFELVNFYGDVPLLTTSDVKVNSIAARTARASVYQQIISDLKDSQELLSETYAASERSRVNRSAATALLARVYLYTKDWIGAEVQATSVINNTIIYSLVTNLNSVFLRGSTETIFQYTTANGYNDVGNAIIPAATAPNHAFTNDFINAIEINDQRKINWMKTVVNGNNTYYYPYKYKQRLTTTTNPESLVVLRLAELYLIRAEARAQQGKLTGSGSASEDLNVIRARAGLPNITATTQPALLTAIEKERRMELFTEWGHRWFDLNRTGRTDAVLGALKTGWTPNAALYPIPLAELNANGNLTQNPGY